MTSKDPFPPKAFYDSTILSMNFVLISLIIRLFGKIMLVPIYILHADRIAIEINGLSNGFLTLFLGMH